MKNKTTIINLIIFAIFTTLIVVIVFTIINAKKNKEKDYSNYTYTRVDPSKLAHHDIAKDPSEVPASEYRNYSETKKISIRAIEVISSLEEGKDYIYFTYDGKVPGPFLRIRVYDTVLLTFTNDANNYNHHSIDLHAVTGPGGGAALTQLEPGESRTIKFKALNEGLYVYHCATPLIPGHVANGMYGLILVEPEAGLPKVDKEFYIMQSEIYQNERSKLTDSIYYLDEQDLYDENPSYVVFNGRINSLIDNPLQVTQNQTIRIFLGNGGVSKISSFHVIGEIFDTIYPQGSLTSTQTGSYGQSYGQLKNVQIAAVFPGGSNIVEFKTEVLGTFTIVDHALARLLKGAAGSLIVTGAQNGSQNTDDIYSIVE